MADRIITFQYATEENSLNKVVKTVHWRYRGIRLRCNGTRLRISKWSK